MTALFEARELGFAYRGRPDALADVSFTLETGENLGIVGESGAGKSTLLRLMLGLTRPSSGTLLTDGSAFDSRSRSALRAHRRFAQAVFQDPYSSLDPRQSVERIIAEPLRSLGIERARAAVHQRVSAALESVGLPADAAGRYPHEFSGGQRQRIAIARAIVPNPRLLLADEPVSALDVSTRVRIIELLAELGSGESPLTVVVVSHDLGVVAALCQRMLVLENGRVVEQGRTDAVLSAPQHPYTRRLLASVPRLPA
ncbi:ABC transporter ATP-binding protein [Lacisediminihabitans changchengi]|uniref:ABC transporter ATP-binding protein n=1 Tax=Lacisediminihabitans changchengi TaxID=2787634 RepID=A0A934SPB9_9MICO|nr:ATP-binding cassette domain-containing protein [Lacisediminihabitans changchengi]MBK4346583.1 ABC transporter ATP-binding protein [Lacisediminihabitans changchengi]